MARGTLLRCCRRPTGVDDADRHLRTRREVRRAVVQHARARLGLHVEERVRLQRLEERREVEVAHRRRVDELQRGARNARVALAIADTVLPPSRIWPASVRGLPVESRRGTMSLKNCCCVPRS